MEERRDLLAGEREKSYQEKKKSSSGLLGNEVRRRCESVEQMR